MATTPYNTQQEYYENEEFHGKYQYVSLKDIINNFMMNYVGDDKLINNIKRNLVIFHAKRGLQEINYDALKEVKAIEIEMDDNLTLILPEDYVNYVRVSWVDENGNFHPMSQNVNTIIGRSYLQDHEYNILFDNNGNILKSNKNSYDQSELPTSSLYLEGYSDNGYVCKYYECSEDYRSGGRFGLETSEANVNGWFTIDKRSGVMKFSSNVKSKNIVLEYISDGIENLNEEDILINKMAVQSLYNYIRWVILDNKLGVQEYIVRRVRKDYYNSLRISKARLQNIRYNELVQSLRGKSKWIK